MCSLSIKYVYEKQFGQKINIRLKTKETVNLILTNIEGKTIIEKSFQETCQLSTNNLSKGIYFIKLESEKGISSQKIVIQ